MQGAYAMRDESIGPTGDGVIRINGAEVMRLDPGFSLEQFEKILPFCPEYRRIYVSALRKAELPEA